MTRLTYKNSDGTWGLNNGYDMHKISSELYGALWKLKDYEETGLEPGEIEAYKELGVAPEQIREVSKLYLEKCMEVNKLRAELKEFAPNTNVGNKDGWIPVEEGLPEERDSIFKKWKGTDKWNDAMFEKVSDIVIVTIEGENGKRKTTYGHTLDGKWQCDALKCNPYRIVAWKPLPEPYKAEGE